jgi:putative ABC transport system substrate-binding protein
MATGIGRRDFCSTISIAAGSLLWSSSLRAQQQSPIIGFLNSLPRETWLDNLASFRHGLADAGFIEGQNVTIEYRWAEGHYERLPALARDLAQRHVDLIAATGGNPATLVARAATTEIPIVFIVAGDPVTQGLVAALNRPGGNMTGVSIVTTSLEAKRSSFFMNLLLTQTQSLCS